MKYAPNEPVIEVMSEPGRIHALLAGRCIPSCGEGERRIAGSLLALTETRQPEWRGHWYVFPIITFSFGRDLNLVRVVRVVCGSFKLSKVSGQPRVQGSSNEWMTPSRCVEGSLACLPIIIGGTRLSSPRISLSCLIAELGLCQLL